MDDDFDIGNDEMPVEAFLATCNRIEAALRSVADEGTHIDTGGGIGSRDLWVKIGGVEFLVQVSVSKPAPANNVWAAIRGPLAS